MQRDRLIQLSAGGVMAVFLAISIALTPALAASAGRNRLVYSSTTDDSTPPQVALGIAMGAFRGLFVSMLWVRANEKKEEGKYYEAVDLASTITKLQPRFPRVWAFHAWNLAYNISVATQTLEERWNWVRSGIDLLRQEGIPANPSNSLLHKELAWIFLHKVQGIMDDANHYYKLKHAHEWTLVIGTPEYSILSANQREPLIAQLRKIQGAPDSLAELYDRAPGSSEMIERLREGGVSLDPVFLELFEVSRSLGRASEDVGFDVGYGGVDRATVDFINSPENHETFAQIAAYIRKRLIEDEYNMELDRMIRYTEEIGPLDWRHPSAHAFYWARRGVEEALLRKTEDNAKDYDFLNTDRIAIQSVQSLFRSGRVQYDLLNPEFYLTLPHTSFIDKYEKMVRIVAERNVVYDSDGNKVDMNLRSFNMYQSGFENFLKDAIRYLYREGNRELAQQYLDDLRSSTITTRHDPNKAIKMAKTLDEFVVAEIVDDDRFTNPDVALQEITGALHAAYVALLNGDSDGFEDQFRYAREFHAIYVEKQVFNVAVNQGRQSRLEKFPREFGVLAGWHLAIIIDAVKLPHGPTLYRRVPEELRKYAYYYLDRTSFMRDLRSRTEEGGMTAAELWMPQPEGMAGFAARLEARQQVDENTVGPTQR